MKKRIIISIGCVALAIIIVLVIALTWFSGSGFHAFWKFANFNITKTTCYIIPEGTDTVAGQTTMTLQGLENDFSDAEDYSSWVFEIPGYTDILPEGEIAAGCHDGEWSVVYASHFYPNDNAWQDMDEDQYMMAVIKIVDNVPIAFIDYSDELKIHDVYAVCVDSEEEALRLYHEYLESK